MIVDWNQIVADQLTHAGFLGILFYLVRDAFLAPVTRLTDKVVQNEKVMNQHVDECNRIPKAVIVERLDHLKEGLDEIKDVLHDGSGSKRKA